jgi:hypothetical protein
MYPSVHFEVLAQLAEYGVKQVFTSGKDKLTGLYLMVDASTTWEGVATLARAAKAKFPGITIAIFNDGPETSKSARWFTGYLKHYRIASAELAKVWGVSPEVTDGL